MHWAPLSQQWKDETRWMTKGERDLGCADGREAGEEDGGVSPKPTLSMKVSAGAKDEAFKIKPEEEKQQTQTRHFCFLSLMIFFFLLACTETYKNNTALISTWHRVIITVLQMFKKKNKGFTKREKKTSDKMEHLHHSLTIHLFPLAWNEARPETQVDPKYFPLSNSQILLQTKK